jgi:hypothetical protein
MFSPFSSNRHWILQLAPAAIAALLLLATPARAGDECLVGTWGGTLKEKGDKGISLTAIQVTVLPTLDQFPESSDGKGLPPDSKQYIHFGPPMSCRLDLYFAGLDEGVYYLTMTKPSGGKCNNLNDVQIQLTCLPDGKLQASIPAAKNSAAKKFELTRSKK